MEPRWRDWGADRKGSPLGPVPLIDSAEQIAQGRTQNVFDHLERLDVDPAIAAQLANIDPEGTYVVIAKVRGGSGRSGKDTADRKGAEDHNQVVHVGRGSRLWGTFLHLADPDGGGSELLDIEVIEASPGAKDEAFPLWSGETVDVGGRTIEGTGQRAMWESYRATKATRKGRKKKSGGMMTAAERRKWKSAERSKKARSKKTRAKHRELQKADPVAAAKKRRAREKAAATRAKNKRKQPGKGRTR